VFAPGGADTLWVRVSDGTQWSPWSQSFSALAAPEVVAAFAVDVALPPLPLEPPVPPPALLEALAGPVPAAAVVARAI
jgi:hypothetical protein